jgi:hypothetical protein
MIEKPPPVLGNARVLEHAVPDESVTYSGRSSIFVGDEELGRVPCLAICEDLKDKRILLLFCDHEWDVLAAATFESRVAAKDRAERIYPGLSSRWIESHVTEEEASKVRDEMCADHRCSFCGKTPYDVNQVIERNSVRICDSCIEQFHALLHETSPSKE